MRRLSANEQGKSACRGKATASGRWIPYAEGVQTAFETICVLFCLQKLPVLHGTQWPQQQNRMQRRIRIQIHSLLSKRLQKHPILFSFLFTAGDAASLGFPHAALCRHGEQASYLTLVSSYAATPERFHAVQRKEIIPGQAGRCSENRGPR